MSVLWQGIFKLWFGIEISHSSECIMTGNIQIVVWYRDMSLQWVYYDGEYSNCGLVSRYVTPVSVLWRGIFKLWFGIEISHSSECIMTGNIQIVVWYRDMSLQWVYYDGEYSNCGLVSRYVTPVSVLWQGIFKLWFGIEICHSSECIMTGNIQIVVWYRDISLQWVYYDREYSNCGLVSRYVTPVSVLWRGIFKLWFGIEICHSSECIMTGNIQIVVWYRDISLQWVYYDREYSNCGLVSRYVTPVSVLWQGIFKLWFGIEISHSSECIMTGNIQIVVWYRDMSLQWVYYDGEYSNCGLVSKYVTPVSVLWRGIFKLWFGIEICHSSECIMTGNIQIVVWYRDMSLQWVYYDGEYSNCGLVSRYVTPVSVLWQGIFKLWFGIEISHSSECIMTGNIQIVVWYRDISLQWVYYDGEYSNCGLVSRYVTPVSVLWRGIFKLWFGIEICHSSECIMTGNIQIVVWYRDISLQWVYYDREYSNCGLVSRYVTPVSVLWQGIFKL